MATHMAHYLELESHAVVSWHRGMGVSPEDTLKTCNPILILISDDAIARFVNEHPFLYNHRSVHFSGSISMAEIPGLHPLMTFGPELYERGTYRTVPFIEEAGSVGFSDVFPYLRNPSFRLDSSLKPLYHALCVMTGNFTTILWSKAIDTFTSTLGLSESVLHPYLRQTCLNIEANGASALTGPLARQDWETVSSNLNALRDDPFKKIYSAFAEVFGFTGDRL